MDEKRQNISQLLDYYAPVLSGSRRDALDLYYNEDFSLAEIAENLGISRQGVRDAIVRGEAELAFLEESLGAAKRELAVRDAAQAILAMNPPTDIKKIAEALLGG